MSSWCKESSSKVAISMLLCSARLRTRLSVTKGGAGEVRYSIGLSSTCDRKERSHFFVACCRRGEVEGTVCVTTATVRDLGYFP